MPQRFLPPNLCSKEEPCCRRGCWPLDAQVELILSGMPDPEFRLSIVFLAWSVVEPAATHGWEVEGPAETTPVDAIELVPAVVERPKAPLKPLELLRVPKAWDACDPVLCIVIPDFCKATDSKPDRLCWQGTSGRPSLAPVGGPDDDASLNGWSCPLAEPVTGRWA